MGRRRSPGRALASSDELASLRDRLVLKRREVPLWVQSVITNGAKNWEPPARAKRARKFPSAHFAKISSDKKTFWLKLIYFMKIFATEGRVDCSLQIPNGTEGCRRKLFNLVYILV